MAQNIYDDEVFFSGYSTLPRSLRGLDAAPEWPTLRRMVASVHAKRVDDLGCGFGWFCRWALQHGATAALGINLSQRMLRRAQAESTSPDIRYEPVHHGLKSGGTFVFSVEHPIFTAPTNPGFRNTDDGRATWPVDRYLDEGERVTNWFAPRVVKQHRTIGHT